jgi:hypothetical protein
MEDFRKQPDARSIGLLNLGLYTFYTDFVSAGRFASDPPLYAP